MRTTPFCRLLVAGQGGDLGHAGELVEHEAHVAQRRVVFGHPVSSLQTVPKIKLPADTAASPQLRFLDMIALNTPLR
jgi:hypothetical protein